MLTGYVLLLRAGFTAKGVMSHALPRSKCNDPLPASVLACIYRMRTPPAQNCHDSNIDIDSIAFPFTLRHSFTPSTTYSHHTSSYLTVLVSISYNYIHYGIKHRSRNINGQHHHRAIRPTRSPHLHKLLHPSQPRLLRRPSLP